ncbi:MAG: hypothetical protein DWP92_07740 [Armatimonadetes bacterium]|nr:MAG: hypothetical protein DWP92_07740 [Armatimonadota bacterium]
MVAIRIAMGALVALLAVVVAVPAVALIDLITGGTGLGLCESSLGTCETSLFALLELALVFAVLVASLGFGIAGCMRLLSRSQRQPIR